MLIGSMFGEKILLGTPLLQWYLNHGLEVTQIYQVVQYVPEACFTTQANTVTAARRQGDQDPSKAIIGEAWKLTGNGYYGKTVTNQDKHVDVTICNTTQMRRKINSPLYRTTDAISEDTYEVKSGKKTIRYNLPLQIGCMVYQLAKLRMLEFIYDFLHVYFHRSDWQLMEMDTDSAYMAVTNTDWESLVKPECRQHYEAERDQWLPRRDHYNFDKRTPGLFKLEWTGDVMIALASKTYYGEGEEGHKFSCKGVNRSDPAITRALYQDVLQTQVGGVGTNRGFRLVDHQMRTYHQERQAFTYFYPKRKVLPDGVSTTYLDL